MNQHAISDYPTNSGVQLTVPESVSVAEGGQQQVCVRIENYYIVSRERNVLVSFMLDPTNLDIGK